MATAVAHHGPDLGEASRGRHGVPWRTVVVLALVLAYADGYWLVSLQGAIGAIQRTDSPFDTWLRESTMMLPVFALGVLAALTLALRWFRPDAERVRTVAATGLLVVAAGTLVGVCALVASAVYDYHLQAGLLASVSHVRGPHGHCDASCLAQEDRDSLEVQVRGVLLVSRWLLLTNLALVGWVVGLSGGRLRVATTGRASSSPMPRPRPAQVRALLAGSLLATAVVHAAMVPEHLDAWPASGLFFVVLGAAQVAVAALVLVGVRRTALVGAVVTSAGPLLLWLWSRSLGLPFGPDAGVRLRAGLPDLAVVALEVVALVVAVDLIRPARASRGRQASAHVRGLVLVALVAVTALGVAGTGLSWVDAFGLPPGL